MLDDARGVKHCHGVANCERYHLQTIRYVGVLLDTEGKLLGQQIFLLEALMVDLVAELVKINFILAKELLRLLDSGLRESADVVTKVNALNEGALFEYPADDLFVLVNLNLRENLLHLIYL